MSTPHASWQHSSATLRWPEERAHAGSLALEPRTDMSRELKFVLHAALTGASPCSPTDLDWREVHRLAVRHRVEGLVAAAVPAGAVPDPAGPLLEATRRRLAVTYLAQLAETAELSRLLETSGIASLSLKGCAIAQTYYLPHPHLRAAIDIDLIVDPRDFTEADRVLRRRGYARASPDFDPPARAEDMIRLLVNSYEYAHPQTGLKIELHHRLVANPYVLPVPFSELMTSASTVPIGLGSVRTLAGPPLLAYLCTHAAGHAFFRLKWLADIHRVFAHTSRPEMASTLAAARGWGCERAVVLALLLHEELTGLSTLPIEPAERRRMAPLVAYCRLALARPEADGHGLTDIPDDLRALRYAMRLAATLPARLFPLLRLLTHPDDARVLKLGTRWVWLYAIAGRPLAARRLVGRTLAKPGGERA